MDVSKVIFASCYLFLFAYSCDFSPEDCGAFAPGDILLGGLFPYYARVENLSNYSEPVSLSCSQLDIKSFTRSLAMVYTINSINEQNLLPGIRLGYIICSTCASASKAIQATLGFLSKNGTLPVSCSYEDYLPVVKAIIGAGYSEESIAIANILGRFLMPQVSYASSAADLSDKLRYPSFFRTVPSDVYQTEALAQLFSSLNWNWVGIISSDDSYGVSALQSFLSNAQNVDICVEYQLTISSFVGTPGSNSKITEAVQTIKSSTAEVIVVFMKAELVIQLLTEVINQNISKTWIASDAWSTSTIVAQINDFYKVGNIFGFSFKNGIIDGFEDYLRNLTPGPNAVNAFIEEYKRSRFGCNENLTDSSECMSSSSGCAQSSSIQISSEEACKIKNPLEANDDFLVKNLDHGGTYSTNLAVMAITKALQSLLKCNGTVCNQSLNFPPWKLWEQLKKSEYFDSSGDSLNGYDLLYWDIRNGNSNNFLKVVGNYSIINNTVTVIHSQINWNTKNKMPPNYRCSEPCKAGTVKNISKISCCFTCVPCPAGYFSDSDDMQKCTPCQTYQWSEIGSALCKNKTIEYLRWDDGFSIVLLSFTALGFLALLFTTVVFTLHFKTPAVKVAGGDMSYIIVVSLMLSFGSVFCFFGYPSFYSCNIQQPLYGISFALCVSCILVKSLRIFLAFKWKFENGKKLFKPYFIITFFTGLQGFLCCMWLTMRSPSVQIKYSDKSILIQCDQGSSEAFGIMLGYIGFLALICFLLAYKSRKLPRRYKESSFITFSMLVYLFVWVSFIPIYIKTTGVYQPAIQVAAILASNYAVICCHLMPKCYIILFKNDCNNPESYIKSIRDSIRLHGTKLSVILTNNAEKANTPTHRNLEKYANKLRRRHKSC
ncbi:G-protein coupled receptor family C group 6 member A-like [Polypterus senegalus]|uniref:G-protein coupled receptor family C group 6 member A-like n=1 Tax=Polypterus senegalus TaxID=55291 RepID=UPI0019669616|nr:G-protein coupled receptor family C group 6 member A-like [Polypterus senegalus]